MKDAYKTELNELLKEIDDLKKRMEPWYALRLEDDHVVDAELVKYQELMAAGEMLQGKITTSTRLVKNAVVPSKKKYGM